MEKNKLKNIAGNIKLKVNTTMQSEVKRKVLAGKISNFFISVFKYFIVFGLCYIILFPIFQQLIIAIRAPEDLMDKTVMWIPNSLSLDNIKVALIILDYGNALKNSAVLAFGVMICQLFSTALAGYALARLNFKGSKIIFLLVLFTVIVPQTTLQLPLRELMRNFLGLNINLLGNPIVIYLFSALGMGINSGVFIYLFKQFFSGVPDELEEAAYVDGANAIQVFFKIMLPSASGVILTVGILAFVWQWNDSYFTNIFISSMNSNFATLVTKIQGAQGNIISAIQDAGVTEFFNQDVTKNPLFNSMILNTCAFLSMLPLIIGYLFVQKKLFTEGIERSGIVG